MTLMEQHCCFFGTEYYVLRWNILAVDLLLKMWKEKKIEVILIVALHVLCSVQY